MTTTRHHQAAATDAAWTLVKEFGTRRDIVTGAHYFAYGRTADVRRLAAKVNAAAPAHLFALASN